MGKEGSSANLVRRAKIDNKASRLRRDFKRKFQPLIGEMDAWATAQADARCAGLGFGRGGEDHPVILVLRADSISQARLESRSCPLDRRTSPAGSRLLSPTAIAVGTFPSLVVQRIRLRPRRRRHGISVDVRLSPDVTPCGSAFGCSTERLPRRLVAYPFFTSKAD